MEEDPRPLWTAPGNIPEKNEEGKDDTKGNPSPIADFSRNGEKGE